MKLQEVQTCKCTPQVHIPFSTCWSDDNLIAMATDRGIYTVEGRWRARNIFVRNSLAMTLILLVCVFHWGHATDITSTVFGKALQGIPAAFGDFNSDEYPDLFVINDRTFEILLGRDSEPLILKSPGSKLKCEFDAPVTSVVPGDFDGDAIMDVLVTLSRSNIANIDSSCQKHLQEVKVLWGSGDAIECGAKWTQPLYMCGQPLAMDWNEDMIIDLFGSVNNSYTFWVFNTNRTFPVIKTTENQMPANSKNKIRIPHSHAFIDLNSDYNPDLFVTTNEGFEVWLKDPNQKEGFVRSNEIAWYPKDLEFKGQSISLDTELKGKLDHILPACYDTLCTNSSIFVYVNERKRWLNLRVNFHDKSNNVWGFVPQNAVDIVHNTITLHAGDYNMDGFPDLLATLQSGNRKKTFLLMNEQCVADCADYSRTFTIAWDKLSPNNDNTSMGVFYDFMQDGKLDIIFAGRNITAFKNNLDYDANFIKVMVITGRKDQAQRIIPDPTGRRNRTYGTNLPGPLISYNATDLDDEPRASVSAQLSQSAYLSLHLPYTLFGLGRTPNFVDELRVGVYGKSKKWSQIIPNSQMVVIPIPLKDPSHWMVRLFVTPSKLILQSFIALLGTCILLTLIITVLWWKERREDRRESRQEVHRFNYSGLG